MSLSKKDREEIVLIVEDVVGGKLDKHLEDIQPVLDLIKGSMVMRKVILWFTSLLIAIVSTFVLIKTAFK